MICNKNASKTQSQQPFTKKINNRGSISSFVAVIIFVKGKIFIKCFDCNSFRLSRPSRLSKTPIILCTSSVTLTCSRALLFPPLPCRTRSRRNVYNVLQGCSLVYRKKAGFASFTPFQLQVNHSMLFNVCSFQQKCIFLHNALKECCMRM